MSPATDADLVHRLQAAGLRATSPRLAVFRAAGELNDHPDTEAIAGAARERLGAVSTQAVYDSLRTLTDAGLLRRIEPAGSPARYETRTGDNHHHVVCRHCGVARDVDCAAPAAPCLDPVDAHGFVVDEAEITFWGLCPDCQSNDERGTA